MGGAVLFFFFFLTRDRSGGRCSHCATNAQKLCDKNSVGGTLMGGASRIIQSETVFGVLKSTTHTEEYRIQGGTGPHSGSGIQVIASFLARQMGGACRKGSASVLPGSRLEFRRKRPHCVSTWFVSLACFHDPARITPGSHPDHTQITSGSNRIVHMVERSTLAEVVASRVGLVSGRVYPPLDAVSCVGKLAPVPQTHTHTHTKAMVLGTPFASPQTLMEGE